MVAAFASQLREYDCLLPTISVIRALSGITKVGVMVKVGVIVGVGVLVIVAVGVIVGVEVIVGVGVKEGVKVIEAVIVMVAVGPPVSEMPLFVACEDGVLFSSRSSGIPGFSLSMSDISVSGSVVEEGRLEAITLELVYILYIRPPAPTPSPIIRIELAIAISIRLVFRVIGSLSLASMIAADGWSASGF